MVVLEGGSPDNRRIALILDFKTWLLGANMEAC